MTEAHATEHVVGLGELDVCVSRDLDTVAPGIQEIEEPAAEELDAHGLERPPRQRLVIHGDAEMAHGVGLAIGLRMKLMNWSPK